MTSAFTGRARRRKTTRAVRVGEAISRVLITAGGLGTIAAVATICFFLVSVTVPLFTGASAGEPVVQPELDAVRDGAPLHVELDEDRLAAWALLPDGQLLVFRIDDGAELERRDLFPGRTLTAFDAGLGAGDVAFGFADGTVQIGHIGFSARLVQPDELPEAVRQLVPGGRATVGRGVVALSRDGQFRAVELDVSLQEPVLVGSDSPVARLAHSSDEARSLFTALKSDGSLLRREVRRRRNMLTGELTASSTDSVLPYEARVGQPPPRWLLQSDRGDNIYLAWDDGLLRRIDARNAQAARLAESTRLVPEGGSLTALAFLGGGTTLVSGDSRGNLRGWFPVRDARGDERLVMAHELPAHDSPVAALAVSTRNRILAAGHADGTVRVLHMTSGQELARVSSESEPVRALALAPRADGVLALGPEHARAFDLAAPHPETTFAALFRPVWYEGEATPKAVWQSSSGTDDFEPKLGLWPLVFGTLKGSVYALLFSVPIALLAALYTSEFLAREWRTRVKPGIEMMASLPSVVLGFLAAIVVAPVIEGIVPETLAAFVCVPLALMAGAYVWQLVPQPLALRLQGWPRLLLMAVTVGLGLLLASVTGPVAERAWFAGDIKSWLDGQVGEGTGGWMLLLLPFSALAVVVLRVRLLSGAVRRAQARWTRTRSAAFDLALFAASVLAMFLIARIAAGALDGMGLDPRGGLMSTYMQRNAMVVGFLIGFAVVPIVYTLAEDALSAVPDHLRAASLASGATPWQTALHVVVPTAMSGLFSAVMIGVGRVVGETMIVLMAAGNTPVLDWNIFNGFRTLSATIAVELPEAVQNGTLYRVLFLAALTLFAMTFVINTFAEIVRLRFRKRAYEL
jgi:phosphate transport system permease protein